MTLKNRVLHSYHLLIQAGRLLQPVFLLALRCYWGWAFFVTGRGKLLNLDKTTDFFASLGIPFPKLNVLLAGTTEAACGLLLLVGLGSRLVSLPLIFTLAVAYLTADREALLAIWSEPDKFLMSDPFLFLLTCLIILAFGPGAFSVDRILAKRFWPQLESETAGLDSREDKRG